MTYNPDRYDKYYNEVHPLTAAQKQQANQDASDRQQNLTFTDFRSVNWDAYDHATLYNMVMKANPGELGTRAVQWSTLADEISATTGRVRDVVQDLLGTWRGPAALRAAEANTRLTQWAGEAAHTSAQIGEGLSNFTDAVSHAQKTMPEPVFYFADRHFDAGYDVKAGNDPASAVLLKQLTTDQHLTVAQRNEAKAKAVHVMQTYASQSHDVQTALPDYRTAPTTTQASGDPTFAEFTPPTQRHPGHESSDPKRPVPPTPDPPGSPTAPTGGTYVAANTPVASPTSAANPGNTYGTPTGSGYGSGQGSYSPGFGSGSAGGGAMSGVGENAARGSALERGLAGRGGATGSNSMYGPMSGSGARGEDDIEHKSRYEEGLDLFDDLPPAYPPVFGA
ncbi:WXG100 family type VII secretion target [Actinokineospora inagensis]|uniref:WXG100 family type VII secretion target n=1 Tax=Actinokineospora inagensis TaxID=103730 RepID=UPI0004139683|nr:PPE domain-containing protein [Actinokineospora inagensis]